MGTGTTQDRPDNSRRLGDPHFRREQAPRATAVSPQAAGSGTRAEIRGKAGTTVRDASRTSDQHGHEPGHLTRRRARSERKAEGALGRRANGTEAPARTAEVREESPVPDGRRRAPPAVRGRRASGEKGGEHGHELKIRRPGGVRARALARRRAATLPRVTARGRRDGAGRGSAKAQVTGPLRRRPRPEGGGRAVPESWFEQNETYLSRARARSTSGTSRSCFTCSSTRSSPPTRSRAFASGLSDGASTG